MKRIQRKRTKGWKMPEGAIYVGRPGKWGNPYRVGADGDAKTCVEKYEQLIMKNIWSFPNVEIIRQELRSKDLACWCREGEPCHGDVLLRLANEVQS